MSNFKKSCCSVNRDLITKKQPTETNELDMKQKRTASLENMVLIQGNEFLMGTNDPEGFPDDGEGPIRKVEVDSFYMDATTVTNEEFSNFIQDTGYQTDAEKYGWSFVFYKLLSKEVAKKVQQKVHSTPWWWVVEGADWQHPEGPDSAVSGRMDHPVIHISWNDASAYCKWAQKRLPTEAEWEYAARGGLIQKRYPWGDELVPGGVHQCNIWQGNFPHSNTEEDGFLGTAPVKAYQPNGFGLYNVSGNVWEWCSDWFAKSIHKRGSGKNPQGPTDGKSRVMRGGSYLCHYTYCNRYRVAARTSNTADSSSGNIGFRCVADPK